MEFDIRSRLQFSQCSQSQTASQRPTQVQPTPSALLADRLGNVSLSSQQQQLFASQADAGALPSQGRPPPLQLTSDEELGSQMDYLGTQDFITPADQQQELQYDPTQNNATRMRSPAQLSPTRLKRPRKLCSGTGDENDPPCSQSEDVGTCEADNAAGSMRPPQGMLPKGRAGPGLVRVQSPPCHHNPFLLGEQQPAELATGRQVLPRGQPPSSRYRAEFKELGLLGSGNFSRVFRCQHRMDGAEYALKRSAKPLTGPAQRRQWVQEVQALAAVGSHPHVVRYYSAWAEPLPEGINAGGLEHFYIQLEKCGESLGTRMALREPLREHDLLLVLRQIACALAHMHARGIAHMDVKPDNIYLSADTPDDANDGAAATACYKLGDFGLATPLRGGSASGGDKGDNIAGGASRSGGAAGASCLGEEGDARYLSGELLNGDLSCLPAADVFALGATVYELASGTQLPTGGQAYQDLRQGRLRLLPTFSGQFQKLLKQLMSPNPSDRPSAARLLACPLLNHQPGRAAAAVLAPAATAKPVLAAVAGGKTLNPVAAGSGTAPIQGAGATAAAASQHVLAAPSSQQQMAAAAAPHQQHPNKNYGMLNFMPSKVAH